MVYPSAVGQGNLGGPATILASAVSDLDHSYSRDIGRLRGAGIGPATTARRARRTPLRDIDDLMKLGVLAKDAPAGRGTSYSLVVPAGGNG